MEVVWSPRSLKKIQDIGNYIAKDAPDRAHDFIDRLIKLVKRLEDFPMSGPVTRENPAFRQLVLQGYRVIYRVQATGVEIVTIIEPKRNVEKSISK